MLIKGRLERTETNLMHFKCEVTWTLGDQPNTVWMGQRVNTYFVTKVVPVAPFDLKDSAQEESAC